MTLSRRELLGAAAACSALRVAAQTRTREPLFPLDRLTKFVDRLPELARAAPVHSSGAGDVFRISMRQFKAKCHREMPPTTLWGYNGICPGPTIEARRGRPVTVEWVNELPSAHLFPIDHSLCGAGASTPQVRTVVHVHGARVRPEHDGYPENWIVSGSHLVNHYPNEQDATTLFYHDHAMGITRLNTLAGLMGLYLLRDEHEDALRLPAGRFEVPLVLFDRSFLANGEIFYPTSGHADMPWVSEYYGGAILVNGKVFPYLDVEPRFYRLRLLNSSNGSFYKVAVGRTVMASSAACATLLIGGDQGFHREPIPVDDFILGPGERADVLMDFAPFEGQRLYLRTGVAGILEFRVGSGRVKDQTAVPRALKTIQKMPESAAEQTRALTLGDRQDRLGRSHRMLLNATPWAMPVTEQPKLDSVEVWELINVTDDSHPIHIHLVRFQVLDRQPYDLNSYLLNGKVVFTGPALPPDPAEQGWKDTVRADPNTVTRIIAKFEGYTGRYVWHCHMLEHEDNEMMRPYEVMPA